MATSPPKSNQPYTSTYYNQNQCRSFNQYVTTAVKVLTGAAPVGTAAGTAILSGGQPCSEDIIELSSLVVTLLGRLFSSY
jgi:hypothetical protein